MEATGVDEVKHITTRLEAADRAAAGGKDPSERKSKAIYQAVAAFADNPSDLATAVEAIMAVNPDTPARFKALDAASDPVEQYQIIETMGRDEPGTWDDVDTAMWRLLPLPLAQKLENALIKARAPDATAP